MPTPQANGLGTMERLFADPPRPKLTDLRLASKDVLAGIVDIAAQEVRNGTYPPPAVIKCLTELAKEEPPADTKVGATISDVRRLLKDLEEEP